MKKILARHKNISGCTISESLDEKTGERNYVATIRGFRNWKIYKGVFSQGVFIDIMEKVREIRDKIDAGDEEIFKCKSYFIEPH